MVCVPLNDKLNAPLNDVGSVIVDVRNTVEVTIKVEEI